MRSINDFNENEILEKSRDPYKLETCIFAIYCVDDFYK